MDRTVSLKIRVEDKPHTRMRCHEKGHLGCYVRPMVNSPRFNTSGSLAMFDATRLASSMVICFASMASASVERSIHICYRKTVCVPHDVAAGKFLGAPWGRKTARHSTSPRSPASRAGRVGQKTTSGIAKLLARPRSGFRRAPAPAPRVALHSSRLSAVPLSAESARFATSGVRLVGEERP
jgi:hypothetical protein